MADEKQKARPVQKTQVIDAGKAVATDGQSRELREGQKPSAPANFKLPTPVAIPAAPAASSNKAGDKK
jgi:hypothetical protein